MSPDRAEPEARSFARSSKNAFSGCFSTKSGSALISVWLRAKLDIIAVKYVFRYERSGVRKTCVRRVKFPFPINSTAGSEYMRSTGEFRSFKLVRALENIHLGEFFSSKAKPLLVNTLRGVPFLINFLIVL